MESSNLIFTLPIGDGSINPETGEVMKKSGPSIQAIYNQLYSSGLRNRAQKFYETNDFRTKEELQFLNQLASRTDHKVSETMISYGAPIDIEISKHPLFDDGIEFISNKLELVCFDRIFF